MVTCVRVGCTKLLMEMSPHVNSCRQQNETTASLGHKQHSGYCIDAAATEPPPGAPPRARCMPAAAAALALALPLLLQ